jgi:phosphomannomutase
VIEEKDFTDAHLDAVLDLPTVDVEAVRAAGFKVVLDAVNSVGGIIMPRLLERMGVECICVNCDPTGEFAHNPEPLPANLVELCEAVVANGADFGISVDPDVDRLALICEDGKPFGEEYTLVSIADYLLSRIYNEALQTGKSMEEVAAPYQMTTSSNLSSSRALRDVTEQYGGDYHAAAVGEVNVTTMMKECGAVIGGEGNGGVIYPALHYGRDAMVGVALFLTNLANKKMKVSELRATYPEYVIAKNKIELSDSVLIDRILDEMKNVFANEDVNTIDGVKISFESRKEWVHLRRSNTEPIIRIYAEAATQEAADALAQQIIDIANKIIG